jgi:predicted metal-dependent hydrolase
VHDKWEDSDDYLRGIALFNAGFYWEAHEAWEALWHAHGRTGPTAWVLQALIKLAAAGVKVRERRPAGTRTHAARAADLLARALEAGGPVQLGLNLAEIAEFARAVAAEPPRDDSPPAAPVVRVFPFTLRPSREPLPGVTVTSPDADS